MITNYNITDYHNEYCYNNYYDKSKYTDEYYKNLAEESDRDYEDKIFDEIMEEEE